MMPVMAEPGNVIGLWNSPTVQSALLLVVAGTVVVAIQHVFLPLRRDRARRKDLSNAGVHRLVPASDATRTERVGWGWEVPVPSPRLLPLLSDRLVSQGITAENLPDGLLLHGHAGSHWNPNRVDPIGFGEAELRVLPVDGGSSRVRWRIRSGGAWRAAVAMAGFVMVASGLCMVGERGRATAPVVTALLVGFGISGLTFRRAGQASVTREWIENALLETCQVVRENDGIHPGAGSRSGAGADAGPRV
jgi:hypothetical protein